jgi:hypothetical protein
MRVIRIAFLLSLVGTLAWSEQTSAAILTSDASGWHTWQVDEPDAATEMCCFSWKRGAKSRQGGCDLDGNRVSFSDGADCGAAPGTLQVYVYFDDGTPNDIHVLSSNCPVTTASEVTDHGLVSTDENIGWFRSVIEDKHLGRDTREEALFALVLSGSDAAYTYLDRLLASK